MIPRKRLDISWADLFFAMRAVFSPASSTSVENAVAQSWRCLTAADSHKTLACLSVRSGFDALLSALHLEPGDEVLVSAITIPGMIHIIKAHGLVPVPIDINMEQLTIKLDSLQAALTKRSKMILIAHLFGSRMPMDSVVSFAQSNHLIVVEDCAQAYQGTGYRGHPKTDVCLFSFGPIKTATALGGGILHFRSESLCKAVRSAQLQWPQQNRIHFFKRLCKYALLMLLSYRASYTLFVRLCFALNRNHDLIITQRVRGFSGGDFFAKIRRRPCLPLLTLLARRLRQFDAKRIHQRIALANRLIGLTPLVAKPGSSALAHTYWVFPIFASRPEKLIQYLWQQGFDATQKGSSLRVVKPARDSAQLPGDFSGKAVDNLPTEALGCLHKLVYIPLYQGVSEQDIKRLANALNSFYCKYPVEDHSENSTRNQNLFHLEQTSIQQNQTQNLTEQNEVEHTTKAIL